MNATKIIQHIINISKGECSITEESILKSENEDEQSILLGFLTLFEELKYRETSLKKAWKEKDIYQEKIFEIEKNSVQELKNSFVSTASHQFRTPLAVIQANVGLFKMLATNGDKIELQKYKKVTSRITVAIAKMTELIDEVLVLDKLTSGKIPYKPKDVDLLDFCKKLAKEFNPIQADGRVIAVLTDGEPYHFCLDPKLLTHSLSNLISNAFKYSLGYKNPELTIYFKPKELIFSVRDYGIGIPIEEQSKLFQPFFRAKNVIEIKGTGLGLSIAKEYVEINKGQIFATPILGKGSCFQVKFKR
jgi:signal transduction histidine kinase